MHQAVRDLTALHGRDALTIPQIAARAGVTPSTIYRRWGDLVELLADVSIERLRDEADPPDTGSVRGDLLAWGEQFLEEMSSELGRQVLKDVLTASGYGDGSAPCQCLQITAGQITMLVGRARSRGQATPSVDCVLDTLVAPIIYRLLMGRARPRRSRWCSGWMRAWRRGPGGSGAVRRACRRGGSPVARRRDRRAAPGAAGPWRCRRQSAASAVRNSRSPRISENTTGRRPGACST